MKGIIDISFNKVRSFGNLDSIYLLVCSTFLLFNVWILVFMLWKYSKKDSSFIDVGRMDQVKLKSSQFDLIYFTRCHCVYKKVQKINKFYRISIVEEKSPTNHIESNQSWQFKR